MSHKDWNLNFSDYKQASFSPISPQYDSKDSKSENEEENVDGKTIIFSAIIEGTSISPDLSDNEIPLSLLPPLASPSLIRSSEKNTFIAIPPPIIPKKSSYRRIPFHDKTQINKVCRKLEDEFNKYDTSLMNGENNNKDDKSMSPTIEYPTVLLPKAWSLTYFDECLDYLINNVFNTSVLDTIIEMLPLIINNVSYWNKIGWLFRICFINFLYVPASKTLHNDSSSKYLEILEILMNGMITGNYKKYGTILNQSVRLLKMPGVTLDHLIRDYIHFTSHRTKSSIEYIHNPRTIDNILSYYYNYLSCDNTFPSSLFELSMKHRLYRVADDLYNTMYLSCITTQRGVTVYDRWKCLDTIRYALMYPRYHNKFIRGFTRGKYVGFPGLLDILRHLDPQLLSRARGLILDHINKNNDTLDSSIGTTPMLPREVVFTRERISKYLYN